MLIAASLLIVGTTFGHGNRWSKGNKNDTENNGQFWQQMNTWRQVMHDTKVEAKNTDNGVNLQIIIPSDEAQKAITDDFQLSQQNLATYFESVEVSLDGQENGWVISFSSSDDQLIKRLQNSGNGLWYEFLHLKMQGIMHSNNGNHHMAGNYNGHMGQGYGMRGNYNGHMGQGHGMRGNYNGQMGPGYGMMHGNYQGCQGGNPGMYQGNSQNSSKN